MTKPTETASRSFLIDEIISAADSFYRFGWLHGGSGNFSCRLDEKTIAITASGVRKQGLTHEAFVDIDLDGRPKAKKSAEPSMDTALHLGIYAHIADAGAVYHVHHLGAAICSDRDQHAGFTHFHAIEMLRAFGIEDEDAQVNIPIIDNIRDRSELVEKLAETINGDGLRAPCVNIKNHGLYVWGASPEKARRHVEACAYLFDYSRQRPMHPASSSSVSGFRT